jgi:tricarballylate dehydrogenase
MVPDVIVVGGGNAALTAAISARRAGAEVLLLERAPERMRGGNTRHTRDIRIAHDAPLDAAPGAYAVDEFFEDLLRVTGGETDRALAEIALRESAGVPAWMEAQGVRWQPALTGTLHLSRTNLFFLGGGKHVVNTYYDTAIRLGVRVRYDATVTALLAGGDRVVEGVMLDGGERIAGRAVVVAAGGFEANVGWLGEYWGEAAERFVIRGTPYNTGLALRALYDAGAKRVGDPRGFHSTACDARAPRFDGGIVTRIDSIPFGIVVNASGKRFYDEGEELWPKRYAIWGKLIAEQPGQTAAAIFDAKVAGRFIPSAFPPLRADSIGELATLLELDAAAVTARSRSTTPRSSPAERSIRPCSTAARRGGSSRRSRTGRFRSTRRRSSATGCARGSRSRISASRSVPTRASPARAERRSRTCTRPASAWPATSSRADTSPVSV